MRDRGQATARYGMKNTLGVVLLGIFALAVSKFLPCQEHAKFGILSNQQVQQMLDAVEKDIKENYYDVGMHGVDLDNDFASERRKIAEAKSQNEALLHVAGAVAALKDSHTRFRPPVAPYGVDYGWRMQAFGESDCYVTAVRPGSDAEAKGLKAGDQVVSLNGITLTRQDIGYVEYGYKIFPQSGLHLVTKSPSGQERPLVVMAKILPGQPVVRRSDFMTWLRANHREEDRSRYHKVGEQVLFWKLPDFFLDPSDLDGPLSKIRPFSTVVLDLRGNPGGRVEVLDKLIGGFFDHDVKVGDRKERKTSEVQIAKSRGGKSFTGKLVVLVDSRSSSAAEIFARVVQLEKRGPVIGDRSAGAVMEARPFPFSQGAAFGEYLPYGVEVTVADLKMTDGNSLEHHGVIPDETLLPTPEEVAAGADPQLARALQAAGVNMSSSAAGQLFPIRWK